MKRIKRRKLVRLDWRFRKRFPDKRLTRQRVGKLRADLHARGLISSAPPDLPVGITSVWIDRQDPLAPVMQLASNRVTVTQAELSDLLAKNGCQMSVSDLSAFGVVAVPNGKGVRFGGTSPRLARLANRAHHGRRRHKVYRRSLIEEVRGLDHEKRATSVTEKRLQDVLDYAQKELGLDMSDLIDHESIMV